MDVVVILCLERIKVVTHPGDTLIQALVERNPVLPGKLAAQFATVKVVSQETYAAGRNNKGESFTGSGTVTYWMAPDVKCPIRLEYKNSFGARTTVQLLSYK